MSRPLLRIRHVASRVLQQKHAIPATKNTFLPFAARVVDLSLSPFQTSLLSSRAKSPNMSQEEIESFRQREPEIREELRQEASFLTKSLYRTCLRSVRLIRPGNDHDIEDFERREKQCLEEESAPRNEEDVRLGLFSMLPSVDREDELRSRAEYYHQFARENLFQESDCLPLGDKDVAPLHEQDVQRFMFLLKKGDNDRRWLLQDMMFPDPYKGCFPTDLAKKFEEKALAYIQERKQVQQNSISGLQQMYHEEDMGYEQEQKDGDSDDNVDDFFDDDGEEVPAWLKNKHPHLVKK